MQSRGSTFMWKPVSSLLFWGRMEPVNPLQSICSAPFCAPTPGRVLIDGHLLGREDDEIRRKIGVVFQDSVLDPLLSVRENLLVRARLYGSDRQDYEANVRRAIETAGVEPFLNRRYGKLSGGQRRRTDIARALVNTPKYCF